jgi:hypothetical protein
MQRVLAGPGHNGPEAGGRARQQCASVQASAGSERVLRAAVSAWQLEGGHARAECEGQARVRSGAGPGRV